MNLAVASAVIQRAGDTLLQHGAAGQWLWASKEQTFDRALSKPEAALPIHGFGSGNFLAIKWDLMASTSMPTC